MEKIIEYTQQEVDENIEKLTSKMNLLKSERTEMTRSINSIKKQIDYWLNLDKRQLKMFNDQKGTDGLKATD